MKKLILALFLVNAALWSIPGHALPLSGNATIDVGGIDNYIAETGDPLDNSSPYTEEDWVNSVLNPTPYPSPVTWIVSDANVPYYAVDADSNLNVFAFNLIVDSVEGPAAYFLIKNSTHTALYQNLDDVLWGVFDVDDFIADFNIGGDDQFQISHITQFITDGDRDIPVPEPAISALLGLGLVGMVGLGRKKIVT